MLQPGHVCGPPLLATRTLPSTTDVTPRANEGVQRASISHTHPLCTIAIPSPLLYTQKREEAYMTASDNPSLPVPLSSPLLPTELSSYPIWSPRPVCRHTILSSDAHSLKRDLSSPRGCRPHPTRLLRDYREHRQSSRWHTITQRIARDDWRPQGHAYGQRAEGTTSDGRAGQWAQGPACC